MREQRNAHKGSPPRTWIRLSLIATEGETFQLEALADTGNPCALIIDSNALAKFNLGFAPGMNTNFGPLEGGWLRVCIPELGFDVNLLGYASDAVVEATSTSHADFRGLAGLPLLRMFEFGGNSDDFWLRG